MRLRTLTAAAWVMGWSVARAAPDPAACGRDPIASGDVHALARSASTGDAAARLDTVFRLAGRLAVDRSSPVKSRVEVDVIEEWIELTIPLTSDLVSALAAAVSDPDPEVRACAAAAIERDLLSFKQPLHPEPELAVAPAVARRLLTRIGTREQQAALDLAIAAGHAGRGDGDCDGRYWYDVLPGMTSAELVTLAHLAVPLGSRREAKLPVCALLAGIVHVATDAHQLDPILETTTSERDPYFPRSAADQPLVALARVIDAGIPADREPRVVGYLIAHGSEDPAIRMMPKLHDPASLRRAGAFLTALLASANTTPYEAAAIAVASIALPDVQRAAAQRFAGILRGRTASVAMQQMAHAIPYLTDPAAQATVVAPLIAVARAAAFDEYTRRPAVIALGAITHSRRVVDAIAALLADPNSRIRAAAAEAVGSIPDPALQDVVVPAVIAAVDDPDGLVRADAVKTLGQLRSPAAQTKAHDVLIALQRRIPAIDQRTYLAACALSQLDGGRPIAQRCDY